MSLSREDASWYALCALEAAADPAILAQERAVVGEAQDEALLLRVRPGEWVLYVGGSDLDNTAEWVHNVAVAVGMSTFAGVVKELQELLSRHVLEEDLCVFVGYSRGAAIVLALANATHKEDYVVTLGDPGLVQADRDDHVTALRNQFDLVFGLVGEVAGDELVVSHAHVARKGWFFTVKDVGTHLNYRETLTDDAARSSLSRRSPAVSETPPAREHGAMHAGRDDADGVAD